MIADMIGNFFTGSVLAYTFMLFELIRSKVRKFFKAFQAPAVSGVTPSMSSTL